MFELLWRDFFRSMTVSIDLNDSRELINPNLHSSTSYLINCITKIMMALLFSSLMSITKKYSSNKTKNEAVTTTADIGALA